MSRLSTRSFADAAHWAARTLGITDTEDPRFVFLKGKEKRDISPVNNTCFSGPASPRLVPQVLVSAAHPEQFLWAADYLRDLGYDEINLNAGCPSATVVTKHKGAGILEDPDALDAFLAAVFDGLARSGTDLKVSVKTRLGLHSPEEMPALMAVYNRYPLSELIIHARVKDQLYAGIPDMEAVKAALAASRNPVCFNGNVNAPTDLALLSGSCAGPAYGTETAQTSMPVTGAGQAGTPGAGRHRAAALSAVMCGRGVLRDPALFREMKGGPSAGRKELKAFTDELFAAYCDSMKSVRDAMFRMKELWSYLGPGLIESSSSSSAASRDAGKCLKVIRRTNSTDEYLAAAAALLNA